MSKVLVVYGSTTGTLEGYASEIAEKLGGEVMGIADVTADKLQEFDCLLLGTSTWATCKTTGMMASRPLRLPILPAKLWLFMAVAMLLAMPTLFAVA